MRTRSVLVLLSLFVCPALATFHVDMYLSDGNTPLPLRDPNVPNDYCDVMVGTRLLAIVSSDSTARKLGYVTMSWEDDLKGRLFGKIYNADTDNFDGSVLGAAGRGASVRGIEGPDGVGFQFEGGSKSTYVGRWFTWDYNVIEIGDCNIILTQGFETTGVKEPNFNPPPVTTTTITLHHVPSRDFDKDSLVNFRDFAILARLWRAKAAPDPNAAADPNAVPSPSDLDGDGYVTVSDLRAFSRFWLNSAVAPIALPVPPPDPNSPPPDPHP
jgi:hypothetical protein